MSGSGLLGGFFFFFPGRDWLVGWLLEVGDYINMRCYDAGVGEGLFGEWEIGGGGRGRCKAEKEVFFFFVEGADLIYFGLR